MRTALGRFESGVNANQSPASSAQGDTRKDLLERRVQGNHLGSHTLIEAFGAVERSGYVTSRTFGPQGTAAPSVNAPSPENIFRGRNIYFPSIRCRANKAPPVTRKHLGATPKIRTPQSNTHGPSHRAVEPTRQARR